MTNARGLDYTPAKWDQDTTLKSNRSETTFTEISPKVFRSFTAPTSGDVLLTVGGGLRGDGTNYGWIAVQVHEAGDDEDIVLAANNRATSIRCSADTTGHYYNSRTILLSGLTAAKVYTARILIQVDGGSTVDFQARDVIVEPCAGAGNRAGEIIRAADFPPAVQDADNTNISSVSSTSWITDDGVAPVVAVDFTAASSGRAVVTVGGATQDAGRAGNRGFLSFRVTNNAGTPGYAVGPDLQRFSFSTLLDSGTDVYGSRSALLDDLEPGGSYNAEVQYKVDGGSSIDIAARTITVTPAA